MNLLPWIRRGLGISLLLPTLVLPVSAGETERVPQYGWRLDGDAFLRFGEGVETPHTPWGRPSALGTVAGLFLANDSAAYDVPELGRRMDLEIHGMPSSGWLQMGTSYWLGLWMESSSSTERAGHFEAMLDREYDVIVLGNYRFASLYPSIRYKILK